MKNSPISKPESLFYIADNGVTIMVPNAAVSDIRVVKGVTYTKRTADLITTNNAKTTYTSGITSMRNLFSGQRAFNQNISHWNVSSVKHMSGILKNAVSCVGHFSHWEVSNVTAMRTRFEGAENFNAN